MHMCVFQVNWLKIKTLKVKILFENAVETTVGLHHQIQQVLRATGPEMGSGVWDFNLKEKWELTMPKMWQRMGAVCLHEAKNWGGAPA